jgi:CRISPR-associated exonuclease Cas4
MIFTIAGLIVIGLILLVISSRQRRSLGLPAGRVVYSDQKLWGKLEKPLYSPQLRLVGKPDYLIRKGAALIPVEVKSRRPLQSPSESHLFQLAAYCLLVEHAFGKRPPQGILSYPDGAVAIDYTQELESRLIRLIEDIRTKDRFDSVERSHASPARCRCCGFNAICDQALV